MLKGFNKIKEISSKKIFETFAFFTLNKILTLEDYICMDELKKTNPKTDCSFFVLQISTHRKPKNLKSPQKRTK